MEDEEVSWVGDAALEFLPETDGVGGFCDTCCVDLKLGLVGFEVGRYLGKERITHL